MSQDYIALEWVKGEIEETLQQAQQALEAYVENPQDKSRLKFCLSYLHQIHGTLQMVEFFGAALLAEEMEAVALAVSESTIANERDGLEILMQAIIQLPHYLEHVKVGRRDLPVVLLPILNELRSARGEAFLSETALFAPSIDYPAPLAADKLTPYLNDDFLQWARKLRQMLQTATLQLLQNKQPDVAKQYLNKVFARLHKGLGATPQGMVWLPALAFCEWLEKQQSLPKSAKQLLRQLDHLLKTTIDNPRTALNEAPSEELLKNLLFYVARTEVNGPAIHQVQEQFGLKQALPTEDEIRKERDALSGPDKSTVGHVLGALVEEIAAIKDRFDLLVRSDEDRIAALQSVAPSLKQVADTMGMLGLGMPRKVMQEQQSAVARMLSENTVADAALLDVAGALLYVEATLSGMQREGDLNAQAGTATLSDAQKAVLRETRNVLEQVKDAIVEYIAKQWSAAELEEVPGLLHTIEGSLSMIPLPRVAAILSRAASFIRKTLIEDRVKPEWAVLDILADVLSSVEYFVERYTENPRSAGDEILLKAEKSLQQLPAAGDDEQTFAELEDFTLEGDESLPDVAVTTFGDALSISEPETLADDAEEEIVFGEPEVVAENSASETSEEITTVADVHFEFEERADETPEVAELIELLEDEQSIEPEEDIFALTESVNVLPSEPVAPAPAPAAAVVADEDDDDLIDDEIIEIFLEEAEEVTETLNEFWPQFKADQDDSEALTTVRRAFHTLKGSGRMVKAHFIGELAWSVENMFNRVLDNTIVITPELMALVDYVISQWPPLIDDFRNKRPASIATQPLMDYAFALAAGEAVAPFTAPGAEAPAAVVADVPAMLDVADESDDEDEDDALLDVFEGEASSHLVTVDEFIQESRNDNYLNSLTDHLQRALHTLKGSAHMAGLTGIANVASPLERFIKELRAYQTSNSAEIVDLLEEGSALIATALSDRELMQAEILPGADAFVERVLELENNMLTPLQQASGKRSGPNPQAISQFLAQGMDSLLDAERLLSQWQASGDLSVLQSLESDLGDVAAGANEAELPNIHALAAALQGLYTRISSEFAQPEDALLALAAEAHEQILTMMDCLAAGQETQPADDLVGRIQNWQFAMPANDLMDAPLLGDDITLEAMSLEADPLADDADLMDVSESLDLLPDTDSWSMTESDSSDSGAGLSLDTDLALEADLDVITLDDVADDDALLLDGVSDLESEDLSLTENDELMLDDVSLLDDASELNDASLSADDLTSAFDDAELLTDGADLVLDDSVSEPLLADEAVNTADDLLLTDDFAVSDLQVPADPFATEAVASETVSGDSSDWNEPQAEALPLPSVDDDVDDEILEIFLEEAEEIGESVESALEQWRQSPDNLVHVAQLQRELHTLKGGARMAELSEVADLCHELETLYENINDGRLGVQPQVFGILERAHDELSTQLDQVRAGNRPAVATATMALIRSYLKGEAFAEVPDYIADESAAEETFVAEPVAPVQAEALDESDREILEIFIEEAGELQEALDRALHNWEQDVSRLSEADEAQRVLHTLKGGARLAGLTDIGDMAHDFEANILKAQQGQIATDAGFFQAAYQRHDRLMSRIEAVAAALETDGMVVLGDKSLTVEVIDLEPEVEETPAPVQAATEAEALDSADDFAPASNVVPLRRAVEPKAEPEKIIAQQQTARKAPQELVKVSADLLDNLVNLAGETSIGRGRLEQQVTDFAHTLDEMDMTLERLRDQLRRLDMETEAQVLFRQERQGPSYEDFDPLEMDRYSTMQQLARALVESASDLSDLKETLGHKTRDAETLLLQQSRVNTELQEGLMKTRMVPFQRLVPRLRRIVRQVSLELDKQVELRVFNAEGEMDRTILERMISPLEHMVRNAVDHGIETREQREASGKPEIGMIDLEISRDGGDVVLTMTDDGRGVNLAAVRRKAIERGLMPADADISDQDVMQFILQAGFSTAEAITQISGRGVGMDVVSSEIKQMGGSVEIQSEAGVGTRFIIRLPFTVSVNRALMVRVGDDLYAVPLNNIQGIVRAPVNQLQSLYDQPQAERRYSYAGNDYRVEYLGFMLENEAQPKFSAQAMPVPMLLIRGPQPFALQVDSLLGSREIVVKTLGPQFASVMGVSGGTILGDGSVVIILDLPAMIRTQTSLEYQQAKLLDNQEAERRHELENRLPRILVVDDSVTVRKVTSRLLERNGMEVFTAKDGVDAMATLQDHKPDLMLLDIEMPRMDGFEVASLVRHDSRLKDIPIIMITSRTGDKHRERAMSIGVNEYMGKPFQEDKLLSTMHRLLGIEG
ncbi:Hpt domain-containing protein [Thalassolituus sp. LLYu03]|uniref:hybrid sensor histidine kinase/response regulator n=1 Tax=Thalassolituus sp. LLYu03 TaxID=3421656 RepID=UPI003D2BBF03